MLNSIEYKVDIMTIGSMLAVAISWSIHHSVMWSAVHGVFGWFYVAYYLLGYGRV
jgi:hypothetical protein